MSRDHDVVDVLRRFHDALRERRGDAEVVETVASFALECFGAASATVNRIDRRSARYHSVVNVGRLGPGETRRPTNELYGFDEFPWTTEQMLHHASYATDLADVSCPPEYEALLHRLDKRACLGAPIERGGSLLGELWLTRDVPFGDDDVHLASALGVATARYLGNHAIAHGGGPASLAG